MWKTRQDGGRRWMRNRVAQLHRYDVNGETIVATTSMRGIETPRILIFNEREVDEALVIVSVWGFDNLSRRAGYSYGFVYVGGNGPI